MYIPISYHYIELRSLHYGAQHVLRQPNGPIIMLISEAVWLWKV